MENNQLSQAEQRQFIIDSLEFAIKALLSISYVPQDFNDATNSINFLSNMLNDVKGSQDEQVSTEA